jgi:ABC-type amino acid transport system permease subunit
MAGWPDGGISFLPPRHPRPSSILIIMINREQIQTFVTQLYFQKDKLWTSIWIAGIVMLWIWNRIFLNAPAFAQIQSAFIHTCFIAGLVIVFCCILGWGAAVGLYALERSQKQALSLCLTFLLNVIRSIPQIIGVLAGYVLITLLLRQDVLRSEFSVMILMAMLTSLFIFLELADLIRERIDHYHTLDFVNAMLCCGISEHRIIHIEILWKNSLAHIINKLIAIFGIAVFLQCSVDFIISVGLSTDVSPVNLPITLGSMLAKIDSKQDILAIGYSLTHLTYLPNLFFQHLQGLTTAFLIVFTLLSIYYISNGFAKRYGVLKG